MMFRSLFDNARNYGFLHGHKQGFIYQQKFSLVNIKLKWVKDRTMDSAVTGKRDLKAADILVSIIYSSPECCLPIYRLSRHRGQLGLPDDLRLAAFIRRYPNIFVESSFLDSGGSPVPCFGLSHEALKLHREEVELLRENRFEVRDRLCRLLMLTRDWMLPLQTIDQLKWDLGLPYDYQDSFVLNHHERFSFVRLPDDRVGLKLLYWDDKLAISELEKNASLQQQEEDIKSGTFAFPVSFTRGFGLKRKSMEWLKEWQKLPYTSPYTDASHLDIRTDVSEKRVVGVFHELLHLTLHKQTERKNVSNLRRPLALPQKFTKAFERHPGIFYISKKNDTQTVVLREAYNGGELVQKHPLVKIREEFANLMKKGLLDRSRGVYKKNIDANLVEEVRKEVCIAEKTNRFNSKDESNSMLF
ncbi:protein WHAT'S THIS FACTOR 9, mitochondrial [Vicia villosa]|uniref:protein WHAT'S THIS FACTOR 9, mitochondrial n=1 Tax=Vicia villosa TaxID=3911 RepID=UPI00273BF1C5|nr:protein WHAT'S THIS FACTOR 9, mitochondrial [Vicia villosa]XP_058721908.1 protein WHAT'S THIS FACTOR 9, mitochondrial [Vicia villosa]XP_058721909.1 protein WHAT'S THIS FACTOR 9, mitochondrial [Vicia villosa]